MSKQRDLPVSEILEQDLELEELCRVCNISSEVLYEWVEEGVAEPRPSGRSQWAFSATQFRRVHRARRLQRDLGVETASLPLVLDLLDEVEGLRKRLRMMERLIDD